jgi:anti-anti-sigma factor
MPQGNLVISTIEDVTIVSFREHTILDLSMVEGIGKQLYALVDERALRKIVLDFRPVRFFSSQMIGVLLNLHKRASAIKGRVILASLQPDLYKVFKITRLDDVLEFAANEDQAMDMFRAAPKA